MVPDSSTRAVDIVVRGMVQGVGFRYRCKWKADELGLTGSAENQLDGNVFIHLQGMDYRIDSFMNWLRGDIQGVYISRIDVSQGKISGNAEDFQIR